MKALSIKQPWANMIADGEKTIETRTWSTSYRGPLLIVSSKKPDLEGFPRLDIPHNGPYGYAIAVAQLVECRPMNRYTDKKKAQCEWYPGAIAWRLRRAKRIKPFPVAGRLRLYNVEFKEIQSEAK